MGRKDAFLIRATSRRMAALTRFDLCFPIETCLTCWGLTPSLRASLLYIP
jgi:hypothetical protein